LKEFEALSEVERIAHCVDKVLYVWMGFCVCKSIVQ